MKTEWIIEATPSLSEKRYTNVSVPFQKVLHLHLSDAFIQSDLQWIQAIHFFFISMCVPWELNPQPFALLTQCSTTEPQEHLF